MSPSRPILFMMVAALLMVAASAHAAPGSGRLAFSDPPLLEGTLSGEGAGEIHTADVDAVVEATGKKVQVLKVWYEREVLVNPLGPVRTTTSDVQTEWRNFSDAHFSLVDTKSGFEMLVHPSADATQRIMLPETPVAAELVAFAEPLIVADLGVSDQDRDDLHVFTYTAAGDRFPVQAGSLGAEGDFALFVGPADFTIAGTGGEGDSFSSGDFRTETSPTTYKETRVYHVVYFEAGALTLQAADAVAWLDQPTFTFDGTMTSTSATGTIDVDGRHYPLEAVPVTVGGDLVFAPRPIGQATPVEEESRHVGTSTPSGGQYRASSSDVEGEVTVLAIGGELPIPSQADLTVVATVGVLTLAGAVVLLTPKGQWVALSLLAPLYAKTDRSRLLDNESRDRIFQVIRSNPGINLSQIHRIADLGWGVTVYHLKMMEKNGLVFAETGPRDKCFFENEPRFRSLRSAIAALANKEPAQKIAHVVATHPGLTQREVVEQTGLTQRVVSYYVSRLAKQGLLERARDGNFVRYRPTEDLKEALAFVGHEGQVVEVSAPLEAHHSVHA